MNIKRFHARDMRSAISQVRQSMGPDAVILSNRKVDGGVELIAAMDYDESLLAARLETPAPEAADTREEAIKDLRYSRDIPEPPPSFSATAPAAPTGPREDPAIAEMQNELKSLRNLLLGQLSTLAWGQETAKHPQRARLLQRLLALGLSSGLARELADGGDESLPFEDAWRQALGRLARRLPVADNPIIERGGVVALVGATGVGKTTTIAKLAARYALRHGNRAVAFITTDHYRVAAHEQLRSYARIMGVPMVVATDAEALQTALDNLADKGLILIDTAGMSQRDMALNEQLALLTSGTRPIDTWLTLATNAQRGVLAETVQAWRKVRLAGCILTKIDETTSLGGALAAAIEHDLPVGCFSDGQRVPEDLHVARPHVLVSRAVAIMQQVAASSRDEQISLAMSGMVAHAHG